MEENQSEPMAEHVGTPHGVRTVDKRMLKYHDPLWDHRHPKDED